MGFIISSFFPHSDLCPAIRVTGDYSTSDSEGGLYFLSDERASDSPSLPVWKNADGSRYILNTGSSEGWRIGDNASLADGSLYCYGKLILMSFTIASIVSEYFICMDVKSSLGGSQNLPIESEEWNVLGHDPKWCGSNGSVRVQCIKINGKPFERKQVPHLILGQLRSKGNQGTVSYTVICKCDFCFLAKVHKLNNVCFKKTKTVRSSYLQCIPYNFYTFFEFLKFIP